MKAWITIRADASRVASDVKAQTPHVVAAAGDMAHSMTSVLGAIGVATGIHELIAQFREAADAGDRFQKAQTLLGMMMRRVGEDVGFTHEQLEGWIAAATRGTVVSTTSMRNAALAMLKYGDVQGDVFRDAMASLPDIAVYMGSVEGAANALGRAMQYPSMAFRVLKNAGVMLTIEERDRIKQMEESGRKYEAQRMILDKLVKKKGSALEWAKSEQGQEEMLAKRLNAVKTQMGILADTTMNAAKALQIDFYAAVLSISKVLMELVRPFIELNKLLGGFPARIVSLTVVVSGLAIAARGLAVAFSTAFSLVGLTSFKAGLIGLVALVYELLNQIVPEDALEKFKRQNIGTKVKQETGQEISKREAERLAYEKVFAKHKTDIGFGLYVYPAWSHAHFAKRFAPEIEAETARVLDKNKEKVRNLGQQPGRGFGDATTMGFADYGKKIQDAILKQSIGDKIDTQIELQRLGNFTQDQILRAIRGQPQTVELGK